MVSVLAGSVYAKPGPTTGLLIITKDTNLKAEHDGKIRIDTDGITLNCTSHNVTGDGTGIGINLAGRTGVTVKNCNVTEFGWGFFLQGSRDNILRHNSANENQYGFVLRFGAISNTLHQNEANENGSTGFFLWTNTKENQLINNSAKRNGEYGYYLIAASENTLKGNTSENNPRRGFNLHTSSDNNLKRAFLMPPGNGRASVAFHLI